jgi:hypothetical protein
VRNRADHSLGKCVREALNASQKLVTGEPGPAKLNFYLESAQMSLFFKEIRALQTWLPPMNEGEKGRSNSLSESGPKLAIKSVQSKSALTNGPFGPFK